MYDGVMYNGGVHRCPLSFFTFACVILSFQLLLFISIVRSQNSYHLLVQPFLSCLVLSCRVWTYPTMFCLLLLLVVYFLRLFYRKLEYLCFPFPSSSQLHCNVDIVYNVLHALCENYFVLHFSGTPIYSSLSLCHLHHHIER